MKYILIVIVLLGSVFRLWGLSENPPHLTSDEAALGYNAYSILKTGRDEHGELFPIVFKSFGDWKPGLYVYLTVPFVATLGLTELAVRLPAAIAGVSAIVLLFLITHQLFDNKKVALFASFFLAISPWHIQFSRGAWEAGIALTLTLLGIYFFLLVVKGRPRMLIVAGLFFALTLWTYQGAKLATAVVGLGLLICFWKELSKVSLKILGKSLAIGFLVALPVLVGFWQGKTGRLEVYSIFSYRRPEDYVQAILGQERVSRDSWQYILYHSESLNFVRGILGRWFNYYSGRFLFFDGDWTNPRHAVPNSGNLLIIDSIMLVLGLFALSRVGAKKEALFVWFWIIFAPLPAALSRDSVHAIRTLNMVIPLTILLALGANAVWDQRKRVGKLLPVLLVVFSGIYIANYVYYLDQYWIHGPKRNSKYWQYGYKQMVEKLTPLQQKYDEIVVIQDYTQPYIFFLFYQKYDPVKYQGMVSQVYMPNKYGDVGLVSGLDNITFRDINWQDDRGMVGKLFVVDPIRVPIVDSSSPAEFKLVDQVNYLNGDVAFRILEILGEKR
ncbi:MAG: glycosyltransferase family 39 protein [Candidatus Blackburnbacteria bacterium]|nr:glycosyltransferase family 39 protein [Candidatus Blackburnbacteria bacterium]